MRLRPVRLTPHPIRELPLAVVLSETVPGDLVAVGFPFDDDIVGAFGGRRPFLTVAVVPGEAVVADLDSLGLALLDRRPFVGRRDPDSRRVTTVMLCG